MEEMRAFHLLIIMEVKLGFISESLVTSEQARKHEYLYAYAFPDKSKGADFDTSSIEKDKYSLENLRDALNAIQTPILVFQCLSIENENDSLISWLILPSSVESNTSPKIIHHMVENLRDLGINNLRDWINKFRYTLSLNDDPSLPENIASVITTAENMDIQLSFLSENLLKDVLLPFFTKVLLLFVFNKLGKIVKTFFTWISKLLVQIFQLSLLFPSQFAVSLVYRLFEAILIFLKVIERPQTTRSKHRK
jgi:hypothetical protein